jgi:lysophospholipase L1-like esterase
MPGFVRAGTAHAAMVVGPKEHYLALGDSLAFGVQPNGDFTHGYVNDLFQIFQTEGTTDVQDLGCPGETSTTFITGGLCAYPLSSQLATAVAFLQANAGKVSPVTLDIGANDVLKDVDPFTCTVNTSTFNTDLATLDSNLTGTILPELHNALLVKGHLKGDLVMMNYYDPFQNICPNSVPFIQTFNQHLATDVSGFGTIVDVYSAFGGSGVPNPTICAFTWACTPAPDIHPNNVGYSVIANTFAAAIPPD